MTPAAIEVVSFEAIAVATACNFPPTLVSVIVPDWP